MKSDNPQDQPWPLPYERPNQKWLCGRSEEALPCPLGPDGRGKCRTTAECNPALETKPGEEKGRYRCTRRAEYGGPCAEGPLPSGACCRALPPCAPIRSMRSRRALFSYWILGLTCALLLVLFQGERRFWFANPGPISSVHSQAKGTLKRPTTAENCVACHKNSDAGLTQWVQAAAGADPHPFHFATFIQPSSTSTTRMDRACADCHTGHGFHHTNVKQEQSCLSCHREHQGDEGLRVKTDQNCVRCHGSPERMQEVSDGILAVANFAAGTHAPITRFSKDHPEFGPIARKMADPNTLRFNHQLHLSNPVVAPDGQPLQCAACHQQDAAGEYHQRIRYAQHCQSCHSLQFDQATPELVLPHGNVEFVKAFLGSLPQQYEQFGEKVRGITERRALKAFVDAKMNQLQERQIAGGSFEEQIFFGRERRNEASGAAVPFYGCAYCHEVSGRGNDIKIVKADVPLRWLTKGSFHHREHQNVSCSTCHNAVGSKQTSDVLLPSVKTCASCHRSNAAPGESCMLCHKYHRWRE